MGNITTLNMTTLDGGVIIKNGGGGATINNQDKSVDITENGTTEVVADDGYTGLGKVTINTEVSGGGESSIYMKYYDLATMLASMGATIDMGTFITTIKSMVAPYVYIMGKLITPESNVMAIAPLNTISESGFKDVVSVGIFYGYSIIEGEDKIEITPEYVNARLEGMPLDQFEITKEQFYSLD